MKKPALLFMAGIILSLTAQAQVSFIPKAGVTFSNITYDEENEGQKSKTGFVVGAGFNLPVIEDFLSIQPELLYIQKGVAASYEETFPIVGTVNYKAKQTINYLELPVLAKISFGSDAVKAYVNAGPSIGFGLGGKYTVETGGEEEEEDLKFGDDEAFDNRIDIGAQFGGGIGLQAGPGALLLDVRYGLGLSNLIKTGDGVTSEEAKSKHRVIAITIGYAIPFGGN